MRVLIVKTSSMGDLIHTLPAVTDAARAMKGLRFDWVAERAFVEIPAWHSAVTRTIPIALRDWRKDLGSVDTYQAIAASISDLRRHEYDCIIDAQGLLKSALVARLARGRRHGMDRYSCREPVAAMAYHQRYRVAKSMHAIDRLRALFAEVFGYPVPAERLDYGIDRAQFADPGIGQPYLVFLHASSWSTKLWPVARWIESARLAHRAGFKVLLPWGNEVERERSETIADAVPVAEVLPRMRLGGLAAVLAHAAGVIGVDTGLAHLSAALRVPSVTVYLATNSALTGTRGPYQTCLQPVSVDPDTADRANQPSRRARRDGGPQGALSVETVWAALQSNMNSAQGGAPR